VGSARTETTRLCDALNPVAGTDCGGRLADAVVWPTHRTLTEVRFASTLCWRDMDSNFRSPVKRTTFSRLPNWIRQFRGKRLRIRWQPPEPRNRLCGSMLRAAPCNFSCPHKQQSSAGALKAQGRAAMPSPGELDVHSSGECFRDPLGNRCRCDAAKVYHLGLIPDRAGFIGPHQRDQLRQQAFRDAGSRPRCHRPWHIDAALSQDPQMRAQNLQRRAHRR